MLPRHLLAVPAVQHRRLGLDLVGFAFLALVDLAPLRRPRARHQVEAV